MKHETAGDPMSGLKWTRRTTAKIAAELQSLGIQVSARTVAGLLTDMGFSLRVNHKKLSGSSHPDREAQFAHIADPRVEWLYRQIARLEDVDRSVALLMLDGFAYKEIAAIAGITESNVGVKIHRIKAALSAQLAKESES